MLPGPMNSLHTNSVSFLVPEFPLLLIVLFPGCVQLCEPDNKEITTDSLKTSIYSLDWSLPHHGRLPVEFNFLGRVGRVQRNEDDSLPLKKMVSISRDG